MYENFWDVPETTEILNSTDNIHEMMKAQTQYLKKGTSGRVFGKFHKIKKISSLHVMGAILSSMKLETLNDEEIDGLQDMNELYKQTKYGFEIYNSEYKFRVFELLISPIYPVRIIVDEDIKNELESELTCYLHKNQNVSWIEAENDNEFANLLKLIFTSRKVKFILQKMMQQREQK